MTSTASNMSSVRFERRSRGQSWILSKLTWLFNAVVLTAVVYFSYVYFADVSVNGSSLSVVPKVNFSKPQVNQPFSSFSLVMFLTLLWSVSQPGMVDVGNLGPRYQ